MNESSAHPSTPVVRFSTVVRRPAQDRAALRAGFQETAAIRRRVAGTGITFGWPEPLIARARTRRPPQEEDV